jgi:3-hydroxy-9,10-secoandrosta-1,3,5(10)-triene-9,17-dione monooxygenase reductase component
MAIYDHSLISEIQQMPHVMPTTSSPNRATQPDERGEDVEILSHFAVGVGIITLLSYGQPVGFTANSFSLISTEPALISFCTDNAESLQPLIEKNNEFCVNILSDKQQHVYKVFSRRGGARFHATDTQRSTSGLPSLPGVLASIDCTALTTHSTVKQLIVLGQIQHIKWQAEGQPLVRYNGKLGSFHPH